MFTRRPHNSDKEEEKNKYEKASSQILESGVDKNIFGYKKFKYCYQSPFINYQKKISAYLDSGKKVLEIGAGSGNYTGIIANTGAELIATDISAQSLEVSKILNADFTNIDYKIADIEDLPFENEKFDAVLSSGSLSYGDFEKVKTELVRVLKKDGLLICTDALNNNPVYRYKRLFDAYKGKRTHMTYRNIPTVRSIEILLKDFKEEEIVYFGSMTWLLAILPNYPIVKDLSNFIDKIIKCKRSAFYFTLVAKKK